MLQRALTLSKYVVFIAVIAALAASVALILYEAAVVAEVIFNAVRQGGFELTSGRALAVGLISVYGGYFGAGSGVMLLAATLVLTTPRITEANASKNMYLGAGAFTSALILTVAAPVPWTTVAALAGGLLVGSLLGPLLARRLPATLLRWASALLGFALAIILFIDIV